MEITIETGFGTRYRGLTWDDFDISVATEAQSVREACWAYARDFKQGGNGFIAGNTGTGKTMIAALIAGSVMEPGQRAFRVSCYKAVAFARYRENQTLSDMYKNLIMFVNPDLLFIDDVEAEVMSYSEDSFFLEILRERYCEGRPTIVISGANSAKYLKKDLRFQNFLDTCTLNLEMNWPSYRRRHLKNDC